MYEIDKIGICPSGCKRIVGSRDKFPEDVGLSALQGLVRCLDNTDDLSTLHIHQTKEI